MANLTKAQTEALHEVARLGVKGSCIRYKWIFQAGSQDVTRAIAALEERSLVNVTYYRGNTAAVNITEIGKRVLMGRDADGYDTVLGATRRSVGKGG